MVPLRQARIPLGHGVGFHGFGVVRFKREDKGVTWQLDAERSALLLTSCSVSSQQIDRVGVDRDATVLFTLGALLPQAAAYGALDPELPAVKVHVGPPQRAQLASPTSRDHDEPKQGAPPRLLPGFIEDRSGFLC